MVRDNHLRPVKAPRPNPFTAGPITTAGLFAGRGSELLAGLRILEQAKAGNAETGLITGPMGIGKSSLSIALEQIARGQSEFLRLVELPMGALWVPMLVANVVAQHGQAVEELSIAMGRELMRMHGRSRGVAITDVQIDAKIAKFKLGRRDLITTTDPAVRLAELIESLWETRAHSESGILIVVDEADRIGTATGMGGFVKALTELLARRGLRHVSVVLSGSSGIKESLEADHPSVGRIFSEINMPLFSMDDVSDLFDKTLLGTGVGISEEAIEFATHRSSKLPYKVQKLGHKAYDDIAADGGNVIDADAIGRAAELLGDGYRGTSD